MEMPGRLAVAVSGGPDSMALALLAAEWARSTGREVLALTVDHGLREESAQEAMQVAKWMDAREIPCRILRWEHNDAKPVANVQAAARDARYHLLGQACAEEGIHHLLLGHHADDQAETVLLRLLRGSGVDGLSAMSAVSQRGALTLLRPLLNVPKSHLLAMLEAQGQAWITDPSNASDRYLRNQVRQWLDAMGIPPQRLLHTAARMQRVRDALEHETQALLQDAVQVYPEGYAIMHMAAIADVPEEIGLRALSAVVQSVAGDVYRPRMEKLERLYRNVCHALPKGAETLLGCIIMPLRKKHDAGHCLILREPSAVEPAQPLSDGMMWDRRYRVQALQKVDSVEMGALGEAGWQQIRETVNLPIRLSTLPRVVLYSLPALWSNANHSLAEPLAVPHIGYMSAQAEVGMSMPEICFHTALPLTEAVMTGACSVQQVEV